jgi:energy-converting hydrogenase Eha subunit F
MSGELSVAGHVIMVSVICVALAVMIVLVFLAEHQSNNQRPRSGEQPAVRPPAGSNHGNGPAHEPGRPIPERPERPPAVPQS